MEERKQKQKNEGKAALVGKEFYRNICWVKITLVEETLISSQSEKNLEA